MKRGLVKLDPAETTPSVYSMRLDTLQCRIRDSGASVALIYADVSRSNGIDYLTNFCLYWNEAVLAVPAVGTPVLITKLSKRVQPWIFQTSTIKDVRSGPRFVENIASFIEERCGNTNVTIALNDLDWWPHNLVSALKSAMSHAVFQGMPGASRHLRLVADKDEAALLRTAGEQLTRAVDTAFAKGANADEQTEIVVRESRRSGFVDLAVFCRKLTDGSEYIDVIGQYRYVWIRSSCPCNGAIGNYARAVLTDALTQIHAGVHELDLQDKVQRAIAGKYAHEFLCIPHADIETNGDFRMPTEQAPPLLEGAVISVVLTLYGGEEVVIAAETLVVGNANAEFLTWMRRAEGR